MAAYLMLCQYTQKGIENVKESPARLDSAKQAFRDAGAELKEFYLLMGRYDIAAIVEAPDDETMAKVALALGTKGNIRSETLRAFTEDEYRRVIGGLR